MLVLVIVGSIVASVSHNVHSVKIPSFNFNTGGVVAPGSGTTATSGSATPAPRRVSYLTPHGLRVGLAEVGDSRTARSRSPSSGSTAGA